MTLQRLDNYILIYAIDIHGDDGREEGFVLKHVNDLIVAHRDIGRIFRAAINNGWNNVLMTQAAARTFPHVGP
jgi:hypothetical protein